MHCILLLLKGILRLPRHFCELEWQLMRLFAKGIVSCKALECSCFMQPPYMTCHMFETILPNSQDRQWKICIPLHEACQRGHSDMVKLLLKHGARRYIDHEDSVSWRTMHACVGNSTQWQTWFTGFCPHWSAVALLMMANWKVLAKQRPKASLRAAVCQAATLFHALKNLIAA